jgi:flagellar basal body L-ring protein FlgH
LGKSGRSNPGIARSATSTNPAAGAGAFEVNNPLSQGSAVLNKGGSIETSNATKPQLTRSFTSPSSTKASSAPPSLKQTTTTTTSTTEGFTWDSFVAASQRILFSGIRARDLGVTIVVLIIYAVAASFTLQANLKKN